MLAVGDLIPKRMGGPANAITGFVSLSRKAIKDFTFSDGTFIPTERTSVVVPSRYLHLHNKHYDNAHVSRPFRFSNVRDGEEKGTKPKFVSTSMEYLPFGRARYEPPLTLLRS